MKPGEYFRGTARYLIEGADPTLCLNRCNKEGIKIWDIEKRDDFSYLFTASIQHRKSILSAAKGSYCEGSCLQTYGITADLKRCLRRPCLLISLILAIALSFYMKNLVWNIYIPDTEPALQGKIRHVLQEEGISIWSRTANLDPRQIKYTLLNRIPELSWVSVNPNGGKITVLSLQRSQDPQEEPSTPCHLVSLRDGIVTESTILEGMPLVKIGDSVRHGQILVSGVEDYGLYMKTVPAQGEIYGQTWYETTHVTPSVTGVKTYTGRTWQEISILFGRKSINLSRSSSNLGVTCDKIVWTIHISPPGYSLPLYLQRVIYREYTLSEEPVSQDSAQNMLIGALTSDLLSSMVAGQITQMDHVCFEEGGLYILQGKCICHELLSRAMPIEPLQKGADPIGTDH